MVALTGLGKLDHSTKPAKSGSISVSTFTMAFIAGRRGQRVVSLPWPVWNNEIRPPPKTFSKGLTI